MLDRLFPQTYDLTKKLTVVFIYSLIYAIALNSFWQPGHIYAGGITGISQIISTLFSRISSFEISIALIYYLLNIPLFIIAWFKVDHRIVVFTIVSVTFASLSIRLIPDLNLTNDPIICAVFGGALNGLSLGFALKHGISTGGMDIIIVGLRKVTGKSVGLISIIINGIIIILAGYLFGWPYALYSIISIYISGKVTDLIYTKKKKVQAMIITKSPTQVILHIQENLKRGTTVLYDAYGGYDHQQRALIIMVVTRQELPDLLESIKVVDEKSFISISEDIQIVGNFEDFDFL